MDISNYDYYLIMFSGGKDSTACFLHLLDLSIPMKKIELWHHLVDGKGSTFMDWECTEDYCRKFAAAFNVELFFSWKKDGFKGEMLRENQPTKPIYFETPDGVTHTGGKGKPNTRLRFPQVSTDLAIRWCSSYLKIDVARAAIVNQPRFWDKRVLVISGERAEESTARKQQAIFEPDGSDNREGKKKRYVDRYRIIHTWKESDVWNIIRKYRVVVHPCYYLGYNRCSCKWCIFGSCHQMATSWYLSPSQGAMLIEYEKKFGKTIRHTTDLMTWIKRGILYDAVLKNPALANQAISPKYKLPIFTDNWMLPAGAYGENVGPT